jgi:hypothetical protein
MEFETCYRFKYFDTDWHGTSISALTDYQPGLIRHVATRVDEENGKKKSVEFVVECADGTVNACITVNLFEINGPEVNDISNILLKIAEAADTNNKL